MLTELTWLKKESWMEPFLTKLTQLPKKVCKDAVLIEFTLLHRKIIIVLVSTEHAWLTKDFLALAYQFLQKKLLVLAN